MRFDNDHEERQIAKYVIFKGVKDEVFQRALRDSCHDVIAQVAPYEAIEIMLRLKSIPPLWAYWILHYHIRILADAQVKKLIDAL